jgi:uncharacterized protein (DUF1499 family)
VKTFLYTIAFLAVLLLVARFIPVDTEPFHEDPAEPDHQRSEVRLIGREAPRFPGDADAVLDAFAEIALRDWGVHIVEGSVDEGMITFVARSKVFGFRDFITVKAVDEAGGVTKLSVFSRPRFNFYDWGVNAKRLDRWLGELEQTLRR